MEVLYVVNELVPMCTDVIDNYFDRRVNYYARKGYVIEEVECIEQLKKGDKYLDDNVEISIKT